MDHAVEIVAGKIKGKLNSVNVAVVYRPPNQNADLDFSLYSTLAEITSRKETIIVGDLNCAGIASNNNNHDRETNELLNFIDDNFLFQMVDEPTRGNNMLDVVLATNERAVENLSVGEHLGFSDHCMIRFNLNLIKENVDNSLLVPNFYKANFERFRRDVSNMNLNTKMANQSVEYGWRIFKESIKQAEYSNVPRRIKRATKKFKPKWFNNYIAEAIKVRNIAYKS